MQTKFRAWKPIYGRIQTRVMINLKSVNAAFHAEKGEGDGMSQKEQFKSTHVYEKRMKKNYKRNIKIFQ